MKKNRIKIFLLGVCLLSNLMLFAQPGDTDGTPTDNLEGTDPPATIDSMLLLIGLFAIVFGFYITQYLVTSDKKVT